ncbi:PHA/PHB synthase family protein [Rhodoblastus sp.]|uniref:PHA/PHB synthase family protein n=1 Tax=Rhodoblastus sp. TaxID=1962975 RepID=UPI0035B4E954
MTASQQPQRRGAAGRAAPRRKTAQVEAAAVEAAPVETAQVEAAPAKAAPAKTKANGATAAKKAPARTAGAAAKTAKAPKKTAEAAKPAPEPVAPAAAAPAAPPPVARTPVAPTPAAPAAPSEAAKPAAPKPAAGASGSNMPNFERMADNFAIAMEHGGKALAAMIRPVEEGKVKASFSEELTDAIKTFSRVAEYWLADPARAIEAQTSISSNLLGLWSNTLRRLSGGEKEPYVATDPRDKRFASPDWRDNPYFDFLRQAYLIADHWANDMVEGAALDKTTHDKASFYLRQVSGAVSPSNFLLTNPELLRTTWTAEAENLARGMKMLAEDIEAGGGNLKIRQTNNEKFVLGVNMATTPGKVVFRNELIELLQYAPATEEVYRRPLLIVPPWINKFYILDLNADKSFIRWAVSQGLTVFCVSWINPDAKHADKDFYSYMTEGIFAALGQIEKITGERQVTSIGYCVGGTLSAATLAYMAAKGDDRISSATFFTTQVDFSDPGDLKIFADEDRIKNIENEMQMAGYLESRSMANAFNMLRPNDMIWSYVVNNYLKGIEPMAFDLLAWNSDSTRMPRANHSFYLRNCYLNNQFARKKMVLGDVTLDLGKIKVPVYNLAAKEDHIAPARSVFNGAKLFGGEMRYVLGGSGHIAGVINPPGPKPKYQYWTGDRPSGTYEDWVAKAEEHAGSWWPDWVQWVTAQAPEKVPAREPGGGKVPLLGDAPGEYVRVKS